MFEQNITLGPGTGTFTQHTLEILIMLLGAFLLGLWLGWAMWAKYKQQIDKMAVENQSLNVTAETLRNELIANKTQLTSLQADNGNLTAETGSLYVEATALRDKITALESELATTLARNLKLETELGLSMTNEPVTATEIPLEITTPEPEPVIIVPPVVEPVATTVEEPEIGTEIVADMPVEPEPQHTMAENTPPALILEPVALVEPQPEKTKPSSKKVEPEATEPVILAATGGAKEDLTVVEGIGPKIQMLLNQYGIYTYRQLAETEVDRLKEILSTAGPQLAMHDPGTWPSQANLAANDQWDTLKSVQGFLKGGKKPT